MKGDTLWHIVVLRAAGPAIARGLLVGLLTAAAAAGLLPAAALDACVPALLGHVP